MVGLSAIGINAKLMAPRRMFHVFDPLLDVSVNDDWRRLAGRSVCRNLHEGSAYELFGTDTK